MAGRTARGVSEELTTSETKAAAVGPGKLVLVIGPSGAGKDTLLRLARAACANDRKIVFARRVVTREASSAEDNEQMSHNDFNNARGRGEFAIDWEAHGHSYGLRRNVDDDIRAGRTVVANVSRTVVDEMRRAYADVTVVLITAPSEILSERLAARGRTSDGQIENRLTRTLNGATVVPDITINNVGSADNHARELVRVIEGG
jgi:ribose 1,5-bisphosphokinase